MKLTVSNLTKKYGSKVAVDHVDLELTSGIIGLLGPNGAGKTTMIRLLCDLLHPDEGGVYLDGENIRDLGEEYRDILGYLPQKVGYYPWFSAEKYLHYIAALKGMSPNQAVEKTKELLEAVGLYDERKKRLGAYSGGMLQRIGIAQALLNDPKILILDEPTVGLDPQERIRFRTMIAGLARDRLVILSTHIVSDVEHIATQVVMLKSGKVVAHDQIENVRDRLIGKVCTVIVNPEKTANYQQEYTVANMQPVGNQIELRLICHENIPAEATIVQPCLEDAYLFLCGKEEVC